MLADLQNCLNSLAEDGVDSLADSLVSSIFAQSPEELVHLIAIVVVMCQYRFEKIHVYAMLAAKMRRQASEKNVLAELSTAILSPLTSIRATHPSRMVFVEECVRLGALTQEELVSEIAKFGEWWPYDDIPKMVLFIWHHRSLRIVNKPLFDELCSISKETVKKMASDGELAGVLNSISQGQDVNVLRNDDRLATTLERDDVTALEDKIHAGIDINGVLHLSVFQYCDLLKNQPTMLKFCACHGKYKCFKYLLENGASAEPGVIGECAVCGGNRKILELLAETDMNLLKGAMQATALFGMFDIFEWLCSLEFDVHENGEFGSIFHKAATGNDLKFILYCLNHGFDVNLTAVAPGILGYTPLHCAAEHGRLDAVRALISVDGVDINRKTPAGMTPLLLSAATGHLDVVKVFSQRNGVDMKAVDKEGRNALLLAVQNGWFGIVKYVLSSDFLDPNDGDSQGMTPLHWAAQSGNYGMCKMLIDSGKVDVNCRDKDGLTPLHWASSHGYVEVVRLLLMQVSVDPNILDSTGWTALMRAVECEHELVVAELLRCPSVSVNCGVNGRTALTVALEKQDPAIVNLLLQSSSIDQNGFQHV